MFFKNAQEKERFYSVAIKSRIQLLWMQDVTMRIALWLVLIINLTATSLFLVALLIEKDRTQTIPQTDSPIVIVSAFFPFILFFIAAIYAAGLLIYRWRIRRAVRRQSTIVPMYKMSLDPIETAAMIGRTNFRAEGGYIVRRLMDTGHIYLKEQKDKTFVLQRTVGDSAQGELKWYEKQLLDDVFISEKQHKERLLRSMNPERLAALEGLSYESGIPLDKLNNHIGAYYLSHFNKQIRDRLIHEGLFNRFGGGGMWLHTFLYCLMFGTPYFAAIFIYAMLASLTWHDASLQVSPMYAAGAIAIYVAFFICNMLWFLRTDIYTRFGLQKYVEAEGLYLYLQVALQDKLDDHGLGEREMVYFMPYAQVMGLVAVNDQDEISRLLATTNR